jgi:hypothetical protein
MSWKIKRPPQQPEEPDALVAQLHPLVFTVQRRLRGHGGTPDAIDVLQQCLRCLEAASSLTLGLGWPTTDTTEYYGDGPDPANADVVHALIQLIQDGVPAGALIHASVMFQRPSAPPDGDHAVDTVGQRLSAITKAFLKCLDLPDALSKG